MARLSRVLAAITEPVDLAAIKGVVEELTGQIFDPGEDWRESLFDHLVTNEYVFQTTQILKQPKRLNEAAWQTSQRIAMSRLPEGDQANAELLAYLILGAAAQKRRRVAAAAQGPLLPAGPGRDGGRPGRDRGRPQAAPLPVAERCQGAATPVGTTTPSSRS